MSARRSNSGQHRKVEEARRIVREALGDAARLDPPQAKYVPVAKPVDPMPEKSAAIPVLLISEAASELGLTVGELEVMIAAGGVKTLPVGEWTVVIPDSEVVRLRRQGLGD